MAFVPILSRVAIHAQHFPCTNTKPRRYRVSVRSYKPRFYCADSPDAPDFPYVAQWCAEQYIRDIGCPWVISAAGQMDDGSFVFIVKGSDE